MCHGGRRALRGCPYGGPRLGGRGAWVTTVGPCHGDDTGSPAMGSLECLLHPVGWCMPRAFPLYTQGKFSHLPHQDSNPGILILPLEAPIVEDCSRFTLCISGRDGHAVYILQRHIVGGELKRSKVRVPGVVSVTSSDLCAHSGTFSVVSGSSLAQ